MRLKDHAKGRWKEILHGLVSDEYWDGRKRPCPACGGTDRFRLVLDGFGGAFCGNERLDGFMLLNHLADRPLNDFASAAQHVEEVIGKPDNPELRKPDPAIELNERIRKAAVPACSDGLIAKYLSSRGLRMPGGLFGAKLKHPEAGVPLSVMLAPVRTVDGKLKAWHRTFLDNVGNKASVTPVRMLTPAPNGGLKGCSVQLAPVTSGILGVAEGIETAIAASMLYLRMPVWAALNTSLLKSFQWPASVDRLIIFGDNDSNYAGQAAAYALANRAHKSIDVEVRFPEFVGDFNDVLLRARPST